MEDVLCFGEDGLEDNIQYRSGVRFSFENDKEYSRSRWTYLYSGIMILEGTRCCHRCDYPSWR